MLKYILYPIFGVSVLGAYALSASMATDVSTTLTPRRQQLPPAAGAPSSVGYVAPIIWYTGFHGPSRYVPSSSSSGGYGGSYGGFSGGK